MVLSRRAVEFHEVLGHRLHVADCDLGASVVHDGSIGKLPVVLDEKMPADLIFARTGALPVAGDHQHGVRDGQRSTGAR